MPRILTRRSMLATAAAGLPALAVGSSLLGSTLALGAPAKKAAKYGPAGPAARSSAQLRHAQLRPIAEQVLQKARHAFTVAAAEPKRSFARGGMAATAAKFMKAQKSGRVTRAAGRAGLRLSSQDSEWKATFGGYATLSPVEYERVPSPGERYTKVLRSTLERWREQQPKIKREKPKKHNPDDYAGKPLYKRLELHLNSVKCLEDTNEFDSDEIRIGGQLIRPDGVVSKISSHLVYDNFDPGKQRNYDSSACIGLPAASRKALEDIGACSGNMSDPWAGRVLVSAPLSGPWPGTFGLVLLLVEEDHGGMNELLTELYRRIQDELNEAIANLGEATGDAVAEYLGEDIGAIVNEIVVWVLSELVSWIVSLFDNVDDPIAGKSWMITLPNRTRESIDALCSGGVDTPSGTQGSAIQTLSFAGDGGRYETRLHWRALG